MIDPHRKYCGGSDRDGYGDENGDGAGYGTPSDISTDGDGTGFGSPSTDYYFDRGGDDWDGDGQSSLPEDYIW